MLKRITDKYVPNDFRDSDESRQARDEKLNAYLNKLDNTIGNVSDKTAETVYVDANRLEKKYYVNNKQGVKTEVTEEVYDMVFGKSVIIKTNRGNGARTASNRRREHAICCKRKAENMSRDPPVTIGKT